MRRFVPALTIVLTAVGGMGSVVALAQERAKIVLSEKHFDKEITLHRGDIFEVRLPALSPLEWAESEPNRFVRELKGYPKNEDVPRIGEEPTLGAGVVTVHRFEVVGESEAPVELELVYAKFGKASLTAERLERKSIPKPGSFRDDQKREDLREGMVYHVKLKITKE